MKVQYINKKTFELTDESEKLGQLLYDGLFSFKANAIAGSEDYRIMPKGIFNTTILVTKGKEEIASMQMSFKGHIIISYKNEKEYILKATGTFLNKYVLEDADRQKLILLHPDFHWSKLSCSYDISYDDKPKDILLILLATYAANYYTSVMSSAVY